MYINYKLSTKAILWKQPILKNNRRMCKKIVIYIYNGIEEMLKT